MRIGRLVFSIETWPQNNQILEIWRCIITEYITFIWPRKFFKQTWPDGITNTSPHSAYPSGKWSFFVRVLCGGSSGKPTFWRPGYPGTLPFSTRSYAHIQSVEASAVEGSSVIFSWRRCCTRTLPPDATLFLLHKLLVRADERTRAWYTLSRCELKFSILY